MALLLAYRTSSGGFHSLSFPSHPTCRSLRVQHTTDSRTKPTTSSPISTSSASILPSSTTRVFAESLTDDPAAHATSPVQPVSITFPLPIVPPSPSVTPSSSLGSQLSASLSTSPPNGTMLKQVEARTYESKRELKDDPNLV